MSRGYMSLEWTDLSSECDAASSEAAISDRSLEWCRVLGIEVVLFIAIVTPLACGALLGR
jgi:hypothetical protein